MADPVEFLTPEWGEALAQAANASPAFTEAAGGLNLVIEQEITTGGAPVRYSLAIRDGRLDVHFGDAEGGAPGGPPPDVTFVQSRDTAERIQRGEMNAQQAFVLGKLRVRGNPERLLGARDAFVRLEDVFGELRDRTTV